MPPRLTVWPPQEAGAAFAFKVLTEDRDLLISASCEAVRRAWVDDINAAIGTLRRRTMMGRMRNSVGASCVTLCHLRRPVVRVCCVVLDRCI